MKALIILAVVLMLALFGVGGYYAYQLMVQEQSQAQMVSNQSKSSVKSSRKILSRMRTPKNSADVLDILSYAMSKSQDAVAWLQVPGTEINHVVMQGSDNYYYERRNEDGEDDIYGCYFLDFECGMGEREHFSQNTVIYGHSDLEDSPDGPRFSQLFKFTDLDFAQKTPCVFLTTQQGQYTFEIFTVFYTNTDFDYIRVRMSDAQKLELAQEAQAHSIYEYPVELTPEDRLITLSTCSVRYGKDEGNRLVVMGRLLPSEAQVPEELLLVPKQKIK